MLMDLKLWRDRNLASLVRGHYRSRPVNLFDQDALNAILGDVWKPLDLRWNVTASVAGRRFFRSPIADFAALGELARNPWLLHYSGDWKPWTLPYGRHPYELFFQYLDETPWRGWRPPATARARIRAFYHEYLRDTLYPIETAMAERRVRGWL